MPSAFDSYNYDAFVKALAAAKTHTGYKANRAFYDGDHWQDGNGWIGPIPKTPDGQTDTTRFQAVQRGFVSKNAIAEIVDRAVSAILGNEPSWRLVPRRALQDDEEPNEQEQALIDEGEAALTAWWDERGMLGLFKDMLRTALMAERAPFRLYVPVGLRDEQTGRVEAKTLEDALMLIYADPVPEPDVCGVIEDADTKQRAGIWQYTDTGKQCLEVVFIDPDTKETVYLQFTGGDANTEVFRVQASGTLPITEMRVPLLVTPQIRQLQADLNLHLTMKSHNGIMGGFLERTISNAFPPGAWVTCAQDDPDAQKQQDGSYKKFVPSPYHTGAGSVNHLRGLPIYSKEGIITDYTSPSVQYREPVSPDTFIKARLDTYAALLEEAQQLHALLSGDAVVSGESRKQALTDFVNSMLQAESKAAKEIRDVLWCALCHASTFMGTPNRFDALRPDVQLRRYVGPITDTERDQNRQDVEADLMAPETAMERNGIEDTDAELAMINASKERSSAAETRGTATGLQQSGLGVQSRAAILAQQATAATQGAAQQQQVGQEVAA